MSHKKVKITAAAVLASSVLLSGCGLFGGDEKADLETDIQQDVTFVEDGENDNGTDSEVTGDDDNKAVSESTQRELYLIDSNGYVVSQSLELPKTNEVAKQALEYLVAGGPVEGMLPNGFRAVLPPGTEVDVNLKEDGTIVADFSNEFTTYDPADEKRILQSITWTLTQFDNVEKVQIMVNGHTQNVMPLKQTPIGEGVSRANGINYHTAETLDLMNTRPVTLYFMGESNDGEPYYVPVSTRLNLEGKDKYTAIVEALIAGPSHNSNLMIDISNEVALLDEPIIKDGNLVLNFNEAILGIEGRIVSKTIVDTLVLSLTEQEGVESIAITVDGEGDLMATDGTNVSEPVSRPENVNTGRF
ncbi:GerMN domain-containing protein [Sutcliffiella rhizosphaerae]|uniref:Spore germination protein GerM n=1 Tax=Sutcliffiella rhizosphaerae TaxID=2880967 RepID=A0ABM8YI17_9BACI|nr:GerMN domain-containing protein [Sutcliffiella rhizosphaerae]CAG9619544.1 Spore germination protein GerM [Sutcliffiella rhizosphaerae]